MKKNRDLHGEPPAPDKHHRGKDACTSCAGSEGASHRPDAYGANNKIVTKEEADIARERLRRKLLEQSLAENNLDEVPADAKGVNPKRCGDQAPSQVGTPPKVQAIQFGFDTTLRWSCRAGDYLMWVSCKGFGALHSRRAEDQFEISDLWEMRDGDFVTITNRHHDLPSWFELHPLETSGSAASWMMSRLNSGYKPSEPIDGPNIWRVFAGDRLVWVGATRPDIKAEDDILGLLNFKENAVVIGEPFHFDDTGLPLFGGFQADQQSPEAAELCRKGWLAACRLGCPRVISAGERWMLGS